MKRLRNWEKAQKLEKRQKRKKCQNRKSSTEGALTVKSAEVRTVVSKGEGGWTAQRRKREDTAAKLSGPFSDERRHVGKQVKKRGVRKWYIF